MFLKLSTLIGKPANPSFYREAFVYDSNGFACSTPPPPSSSSSSLSSFVKHNAEAIRRTGYGPQYYNAHDRWTPPAAYCPATSSSAPPFYI
ncbi:unnamed protein product [Haemonchus placei]|uniref:Uncharacterized protein n=1 Tax=Haemonchus placei TaxID=6290 RepID=A0A0N4WP52_HAEPC|nr:unnamed protein product [Haemonchus placei]